MHTSYTGAREIEQESTRVDDDEWHFEKLGTNLATSEIAKEIAQAHADKKAEADHGASIS